MDYRVIAILVIMLAGLCFTFASFASKKIWVRMVLLLIGLALGGGSLFWAIDILKSEPITLKKYNIPLVTDWYFVDPDKCEKAKNYTAETFTKKFECETKTSPDYPGLTMLDCRKMLNNVFYMIEGEKKCGEIHLEMKNAFETYNKNRTSEPK